MREASSLPAAIGKPAHAAFAAPVGERRSRPRLRELEVLAAVVREGKTTAAALRLGLSQSAVSRSIAALEASVGKRLFERNGGRLTATSEALRIVREVEPFFSVLDRLTGTAVAEAPTQPLRIAAPPTVAHRFMPALIAAFLEEHPELSIQLEIGMTETVIAAVANANAHLGISDGMIRHDGLFAQPLIDTIGHVVMPPGHRLARKAVIEPRDFAGERFITLTRRFHRRNVIDRIFAEHGVERRCVVETATSIAVCEMVREGLGLGIVNPFPVAMRAGESLVFRPFEPRIDYLSSFFVPIGTVEPSARRFIEFARTFVAGDRRFAVASLVAQEGAAEEGLERERTRGEGLCPA